MKNPFQNYLSLTERIASHTESLKTLRAQQAEARAELMNILEENGKVNGPHQTCTHKGLMYTFSRVPYVKKVAMDEEAKFDTFASILEHKGEKSDALLSEELVLALREKLEIGDVKLVIKSEPLKPVDVAPLRAEPDEKVGEGKPKRVRKPKVAPAPVA